MTFHPGVSTEDVSTISTGGMTTGAQSLNNSEKVLLLSVRHLLESVGSLHVKAKL